MTATMHHGGRAVRLPPPPKIPALRGRSLRFILLDHLSRVGQSTVAEMVALLAERGYELDGRASKVISDSLRWEVGHNRVTRVTRGVYRHNRTPRSTARRARRFADQCDRWITATLQGHQPPPTPPDQRSLTGRAVARPHHAPWRYQGWIWLA